MLRHSFALLGFLALVACSGGSGTADNTTNVKNPCGDNPCNPCNPCGGGNPCANPCANPCGGGGAGALEDTGVDWSGWQGWTKINAAPFDSKGHKSAKWVDVYVPADQAEAYRALSGFSKGTAIVKAHLADDGGKPGKVTNLTVMAKMDAGYDADNGDWYYGVLSADGTKAVGPQGAVKMCIACHDTADKDFVFGVPK